MTLVEEVRDWAVACNDSTRRLRLGYHVPPKCIVVTMPQLRRLGEVLRRYDESETTRTE